MSSLFIGTEVIYSNRGYLQPRLFIATEVLDSNHFTAALDLVVSSAQPICRARHAGRSYDARAASATPMAYRPRAMHVCVRATLRVRRRACARACACMESHSRSIGRRRHRRHINTTDTHGRVCVRATALCICVRAVVRNACRHVQTHV